MLGPPDAHARIAKIRNRRGKTSSGERKGERERNEIAWDSKKWGQVFSPFDRSIESDFCEKHPSSVRSLDESIPTFQTSQRRLSVALVPSREHESVMFLKNVFIGEENVYSLIFSYH